MKNLFRLFYIDKDWAKHMGATHYGSMYGVPVWIFMYDADSNEFGAIAKFRPFEYLLKLIDKLFEMMLHFVSDEMIIETPIKIKGELL